MEGKDVKSLAAMFEKKAQPPPFKKAVARKVSPKKENSDVKSLKAMFEPKSKVRLDQDKGKFLTSKASEASTKVENPYVLQEKKKIMNSLGDVFLQKIKEQ